MLKHFILALSLLWALSTPATWSLIQSPASSSCSSGTACTQAFSSTNAGDLLVSVVQSEVSTVADSVSSFAAAGCTISWTRGPHLGNTSAGAVEIWYCTNSATALGSVGPTWTQSASGTQLHIIAIREFHSTTGSIAINSGATPTCTSSGTTTSPVECALTTSANNSVYVIGGATADTWTACNQSYTCTLPSGNGEGFKINLTSYTAPQWTGTSSAAYVEAAMAIQEFTAGAACTNSIALTGVGCR